MNIQLTNAHLLNGITHNYSLGNIVREKIK